MKHNVNDKKNNQSWRDSDGERRRQGKTYLEN